MKLLLEINLRKVSVIFLGSVIVSLCCVLFCFVHPQVKTFLAYCYSCYPTTFLWIPSYTLEARRIIFSFSSISIVFCSSAFSKVFFPVIKSIPIYVIVFVSAFYWIYKVMHKDNNSFSVFSDGIPKSVFLIFRRVASPFPLVEKIVIFIVNNSKFTLRKFYFFCHIFLQKMPFIPLARATQKAKNILSENRLLAQAILLGTL